jgi:hypothetical protein
MSDHLLVSSLSLLGNEREEPYGLPAEADCTGSGLGNVEFGENLACGGDGVGTLEVRRYVDELLLSVVRTAGSRDVPDANAHALPPSTDDLIR